MLVLQEFWIWRHLRCSACNFNFPTSSFVLPGGSRIIQNQYVFNMSLYIVHLACLSQNCTLCGDETSTLVQVDAKPPAHSNHPPSHIFPPSGANSFITAHYRDPQGLGISTCTVRQWVQSRLGRGDRMAHHTRNHSGKAVTCSLRSQTLASLAPTSCVYSPHSTATCLLSCRCCWLHALFSSWRVLYSNQTLLSQIETWEYFIQVALILNK